MRPLEELDRHRRIEALFEAALDTPEEDRDDFVSRRCAGDRILAAEVMRLLRAHDRTGGVLDREPPGAALRVESGPERYGPYRILHTLGRGGMGTVHLAVREDAFMRRVALKVIHGRARGESALRRFESERRIMASLNHPNIAQLLDGGVTEEGIPYLAMEYVEGLPVTTYCDREGLGVPERIELFRKICDAVHHAHQNLVIHRDLKPSNILVTVDGEPKLLDFGIAKLQQVAAIGIDQPVTHPDLRALTPDCASPEQLRGEPLTTASDVFSLGVLLYELLTGLHPFRSDDAPPTAWIDAISRREITLPSDAVVESGDRDPGTVGSGHVGDRTPKHRAAKRRETATGLRSRLRGDLDTIVATALRKEPGRRYASAEQLSSDLGRHLAAEPVLACGDGRRYRLKKFVQRRRVETFAGLVALAALTLGAVVAVWQGQAAVRERDRAARALERAEASSAFLLGLFETDGPRATLADSVTARAMLEQGLEEVDALDGYPELRGQLRTTLAKAYWNLGSYDRSAELLRTAVSDLEIGVGLDADPDAARVLADAWAELAEVVKTRGRYDEAMAAASRARDVRASYLGADHPEVARSLIQIGTIYVYFGDLQAADTVTRRALELVRSHGASGDRDITGAMQALAIISRRRGAVDEAEELQRSVVARRREQEGPGSADYANSLLRLARLLSDDRAAYEEAEALFRRVLLILEPDDPERASAMADLAQALARQGRLETSRRHLQEAIALRRRLLAPDHASVGDLLHGLGNLRLRMGRPTEASEAYTEALQIWELRLGPEHPAVAYGLAGLARVALARGDLASAEVMARQASTVRRDALAPGHPLLAESDRLLGDVLVARGQTEAAEEMYRSALAIVREKLGSDHRDTRRLEALLTQLH